VILAAICPASVVSKGVFLGTSDRHHSLGPGHEGQSDLLHDLEIAIGHDHRFATERRVSRLEEAMRPTFNALPKDESGRLGGSGVRYMLHRLFVQRHGWFVNALETNGDAWNSSSPTDMIGAYVGQEVQGVFDKQLNTHGFDLHHAAVLAATLENFVHVESIERLQAAYRLVGLSPGDSNASEAMVTNAMKTYTLMYVLQKNYSNATQRWVRAAFRKIDTIYPTWNNTVNFLDEVRKSVLEGDGEEINAALPLSWNTTLKILETFGERYGRWQNRECMDMKRKLVEMEDSSTGRVPLSRFYGNSISDQDWLFTESVQYLKLLGALDDTDPSSMSVIIANYLNGANNCVAGSKFYDVCCIDECDALISHLEHQLVASEASPERILNLVAALPSDTVKAPRSLPDALSLRLQEIAAHHGGSVPLHGRLFAQWMHHAFPRECTYPHMSGTTSSLTPSEFMRSGGSLTITPEQHASLLDDARAESIALDVGKERALPWSTEEELFVCRPDLTEKRVQEETGYAFVVKTLLMLTFAGVLVSARFHPKGRGGWTAASADVLGHKYYV